MIPVTVLTGFLGSGKTTLLARLLKSPEFARTAVIINEFGEVGIDHDLLEAGEESFVQLETGCLCCASRGDVEATIAQFLARRERGAVPPFERIVIETSGLADPAPILNAVMREAARGTGIELCNVVTTVDCVTGLDALAREPQSVRQVAVADRLVLTKADIGGVPPALRAHLAAINPGTPATEAQFGDVDVARLFNAARDPAASFEISSRDAARRVHAHHNDIQCIVIRREQPVPALLITLLLEALADHCGAELLRLKGLLYIKERPEHPAVIHGVQHVFHAPKWLDRWPSGDRSTRLVLIGRGLSAPWIECVMAALETELVEIAATNRSRPVAIEN
ncbi:MAG: GTP-binding protein [Hyphomicrobiaceae bacterium]|nr:GTP-binding protein [Hyphomicrobiaceae bacterium]